MMTVDWLHFILGGGLVSVIIGLFTLNSKIKQAAAETEAFELNNSEKATDILMEHIVEPLKSELHETRHEMLLLRTAINEANSCDYALTCPVLHCLRNRPREQLPEHPVGRNGMAS